MMRIPSLCSAIAVAAATCLAACGTEGERVAAPQTVTVTRTSPQPLEALGAQPDRPSSAGPAEMALWRLIGETREAGGGDTGRQSELLQARLEQLPAQQIADFSRIRHALDERAYTWDLWGAAYVIEDGCSDDCFRDFRAYLISLGRGPYEAALRAPDSLAPVVEDAETGNWEDADDVAPEAYSDVTGEDIPSGDSDVSGEPRGTPWDDEQQDELVRRYPRLVARFR
jgi:hypothetical protein